MINQRLREIRENRGKIQQEIADSINVARSTYTCYENGKRVPDVQTLIKIADYYAVPLDYFTDRKATILQENNLSLDEIEHIKKYRALDERGKEAVDDTLEREYVNSLKTGLSEHRDAVSA